MKSKFFFLMVLFLGIGIVSFAQSKSEAPAATKDATGKTITTDPAKAADVTTTASTDCKWVDADGDGICDTCGKKDCKDADKSNAKAGCEPAACGSKSATKSSCCSSKDGKKPE